MGQLRQAEMSQKVYKVALFSCLSKVQYEWLARVRELTPRQPSEG